MLTLAILGVGFLGVIVAITWVWSFGNRSLRQPIEDACQQLTTKDFAVAYGLLSLKRDRMIALDATNRVALCEFGGRGVVLTTHIVDRSELTIESLEDAGKLVLSIMHEGRAYEIVFSLSVPRGVDSLPDYQEYERIRGMLAWWRETLSGRTPDGPYPIASCLAVYSSGSIVEQIVAEYLRERGVLDMPEARVVTTRKSDH